MAMSKYNALWEYVQKSGKESFQLTFEEIQEIIGGRLTTLTTSVFWEGFINAKM